MTKRYIIISALTGAVGVILGAFGAHGLESLISKESLETYQTGIFYHLIHSAVLLSISLNSKYTLKTAFNFILLGILLFSFSLYLYSIFSIRFIAFITPFGGISFIAGWISIIFTLLKKK